MRSKNLKSFAVGAICSAWFLCAAFCVRADDLAGRVFDAHGAPVSTARVLGVLPALQVAATTDAHGKFILQNVPPGFVDVIALHREKGAIATRQIGGGADVELRLQPYSAPFERDQERAVKILSELSFWSGGDEVLSANSLWAPLASFDLELATQRSKLADGSLPDAFISQAIVMLARDDPARAARWGVPKLHDFKSEFLRNFTATLLAGKLVETDPKMANDLYERATLEPDENDHLFADSSLWGLAMQLKRPEAPQLLEAALKKAREEDAKPEEDDEEWQSKNSAQAYLIGQIAGLDLPRAERLIAELPVEFRADARSRVLGVLTARGKREDVEKARALLEEIATDASPQARNFFAPSAIQVLLSIGKSEPTAALAIARRVEDKNEKPEALAAASQFQDDATMGVLLREAADAARQHPFPVGQLANIAVLAEEKIPDLARDLTQQALALWQSSPENHAAMWRENSANKLTELLARNDRIAAREMLEVAWARTFQGAEETRDVDILADISGAMASVDFDRALEMAHLIPNGEMKFHFARFRAEQSLTRRLLVGPEKWRGSRGYDWNRNDR